MDDGLYDVLDDDYEDEAYVCAPHWASIAEILSRSPELSGPDWQRHDDDGFDDDVVNA